MPIATHTCRWMTADVHLQIPLCLSIAIHKGWTRQIAWRQNCPRTLWGSLTLDAPGLRHCKAFSSIQWIIAQGSGSASRNAWLCGQGLAAHARHTGAPAGLMVNHASSHISCSIYGKDRSNLPKYSMEIPDVVNIKPIFGNAHI